MLPGGISRRDPATIQYDTPHATRLRRIISSVVCLALPYFSTLYHKWHAFWEQVLSIKCVFWVSLLLVSETFIIVRRIERDIVKYTGLNVKYLLFLLDFNDTWIFSTHFRTILKHQILWKFVHWEPSCPMRMDRLPDTHDEASSRFSPFCEHTYKLLFSRKTFCWKYYFLPDFVSQRINFYKIFIYFPHMVFKIWSVSHIDHSVCYCPTHHSTIAWTITSPK